MIKFTTTIATSNAEIGIAGWQEQGTHNYGDHIKVNGLACLTVKLLKVDEYTNQSTALTEVEDWLLSKDAEKIAECYDLGYVGSLYQIPAIQLTNDTWLIWLNWSGLREILPTPGEAEWFGSRGVPTRGTAH
jgi:hypothetical protein